jgi:hypothetical protein
MSYPDDELKQLLRRKQPPADFTARVMSRIEQEVPPATVHPFPLRTRRALPRLLAIAATIILMILAGVLFFVLRRQPSAPTVVKENAVPEQKDKEKVAGPINNPPTPEAKPEQKKFQVAVNPKKSFQKSMPVKRKERREILNPDAEGLLASENQSNLFLDDETARHLRKAQLLLRSFRNTDAAAADAAVDVAYEKQLSRELLNDNRLYRRAAESVRNLPVKEVLSSLEPFLLDIANLSEKPLPDERRQIKERMREREIVAELQVYSTRAATREF